MEKRYQVFISSTYEDLKEERLEVMKALLELDCIPCGMEYFPAADDEQWTYIKDLIDQCDYYVVIVGGRYGSRSPSGLSYTQKEYEYAIEKGIPVVGFLHSNPGELAVSKSERDSENIEALNKFRGLVQQKLCKYWKTEHELGAVVSRSLTQLIRRNPRVGWIRGDNVVSEKASTEILSLRNQVAELEKQLSQATLTYSERASTLSKGNELLTIESSVTLTKNGSMYHDADRKIKVKAITNCSWDELFSSFAPLLMTKVKESTIKSSVNALVKEAVEPKIIAENVNYSLTSINISTKALKKVLTQFLALGLIETLSESNEGKIEKLVQLTPLGKKHMFEVSAIQSKVP